MKTEEMTQPTIAEELSFDAHEFDGLREDFAANGDTWLTQADRFVRENPWLCVAVAAAAGFSLACGLATRTSSADAPSIQS